MSTKVFARFFLDETGQATTEYVLLLAFIVVPLAFVFNKLQGVLKNMLVALNNLVIGPGV